MNKFFYALVITLFAFSVSAQTNQQYIVANPPVIKLPEPYGKIDRTDLEMKSCDFEPDANAEVLFDKGTITTYTAISLERHVRTKIFNNFGKKYASVRLYYAAYPGSLAVSGFEAETFNLEGGKVVITRLDKSQIHTEKIDKYHSAIEFALPNIKPGCVIEYKYRADFSGVWDFQREIPVRYSEIQGAFSDRLHFRFIDHVKQPYYKNKGESSDLVQDKVMINVSSLPDEPYMTPRSENLQRIELLNNGIFINTWPAIGKLLMDYTDFSDEFNKRIKGGNEIVTHAKSLKTDDERISFIFNQVKNAMNWNKMHGFFIDEGTVSAWDKKAGNAADNNLILYNLKIKSGIKAYPLLISTKNNGRLNPANPNIFIFNTLVVYVPLDNDKYYVLDATNKFNLFNSIPVEELNSFGLKIDPHDKEYKIVSMENDEPSTQSVFLSTEITADGKMTGSAEITSSSYNKMNAIERYKTDGEEKYIKYLCNGDNGLKVSSLRLDNMEIDSLPLTQKVDFKADLAGSDENYIYVNPDIFTLLNKNPFLKETRFTNIDFGYLNNYSFNEMFKIPAGYKVDAMPKNVSMAMPDTSIVFRRKFVEQDGTIVARILIQFKKTVFFAEDYPALFDFYKKMYDMMNEQIVLKKS